MKVRIRWGDMTGEASLAKLHQNKEISKAIEYALSRGWRPEEAGRSAHIKMSLLCPGRSRAGYRINVYSKPRVPEDHVAYI